jgi:clan AA aspartic protease
VYVLKNSWIKEIVMGLVYSEIKLVNLEDKLNAKNGIIKEQDIRSMTVTAMVDTGAWTLVINEDIREKLGLPLTGAEPGTLADGTRSYYEMAGPLEIWWKDRRFVLEALVIPSANDILLGALPLEAMDLIVDPRKEELVGAHGDTILHRV